MACTVCTTCVRLLYPIHPATNELSANKIQHSAKYYLSSDGRTAVVSKPFIVDVIPLITAMHARIFVNAALLTSRHVRSRYVCGYFQLSEDTEYSRNDDRVVSVT